MTHDPPRDPALSPVARVFLGLAGIGLSTVLVLNTIEVADAVPLWVLAVLCLLGATTGVDLVARASRPDRESRTDTASRSAPASAPIEGAIAGSLLGLIYFAVEGDIAYLLAGFGAGLFLGAVRPLFRTRVVAGLLVWAAVLGAMLVTGWQRDMGIGSVVFLSWAFGFIFAALLWGSRLFNA